MPEQAMDAMLAEPSESIVKMRDAMQWAGEEIKRLRGDYERVAAERDAAKAELAAEEDNCPYPDFSCGTFAAERGIELRPAGGPTYTTTIDHWQGILRDLASARAGEVRAVEAIKRIFIGGNHLASALIGLLGPSHPPYEVSLDEAREDIGAGDYYDLWVAWKVIMLERDALLAQPALAWLAQREREAAAEELDILRDHIQEYIGPDDARDEIRRICANRIADLRAGKVQDAE